MLHMCLFVCLVVSCPCTICIVITSSLSCSLLVLILQHTPFRVDPRPRTTTSLQPQRIPLCRRATALRARKILERITILAHHVSPRAGRVCDAVVSLVNVPIFKLVCSNTRPSRKGSRRTSSQPPFQPQQRRSQLQSRRRRPCCRRLRLRRRWY
jgi:hypothetical protein